MLDPSPYCFCSFLATKSQIMLMKQCSWRNEWLVYINTSSVRKGRETCWREDRFKMLGERAINLNLTRGTRGNMRFIFLNFFPRWAFQYWTGWDFWTFFMREFSIGIVMVNYVVVARTSQFLPVYSYPKLYHSTNFF